MPEPTGHVDKVAEAFSVGTLKIAVETARQTAALEEEIQNGAAPVVTMPEGGDVSLPSWLPYAIIGAVGLGGVALVAMYMKRSEED